MKLQKGITGFEANSSFDQEQLVSILKNIKNRIGSKQIFDTFR